MQLPVKISYRGLEKSDKIDNLILDYAARLEKFCDHINRCDIAIEQTNKTHHKGNPYRCRIDATVALIGWSVSQRILRARYGAMRLHNVSVWNEISSRNLNQPPCWLRPICA